MSIDVQRGFLLSVFDQSLAALTTLLPFCVSKCAICITAKKYVLEGGREEVQALFLRHGTAYWLQETMAADQERMAHHKKKWPLC